MYMLLLLCMHICITGNLPEISCVRRKSQEKRLPAYGVHNTNTQAYIIKQSLYVEYEFPNGIEKDLLIRSNPQGNIF